MRCEQVQLELFDHIHEGPDWLPHPDVQAFLRHCGLEDVTVACIGARRTFSGKAWPHLRLIHIVSESVHPIRWLLTLIHELAHIADFRQRVADMEQQWGRPYVPGRRDGFRVWRLDRVHGQRWRSEFIRLAEAAIHHGLFPGNEENVGHAARNSTTSLDDVALDLAADPRVDAEELRRLDEQRRAQLQLATANRDLFRRRFPPGAAVHFDGGPRRGVISGTLVRINNKSSTVQAKGTVWHVPHGMIQLGEAPPEARPAKRLMRPQDRFDVGDHVRFSHDGQKHTGEIVRVNRKTCTVETAEGRWRVAFSLLRVQRKAR